MTRTVVADLHRHTGRSVRVCGWAEAARAKGGRLTMALRDRTGVVMLVHRPGAPGDPLVQRMAAVVAESAVEATGTVVPGGRAGGLEVALDGLAVAGAAGGPLPIGPGSSLEDRLDWRYLDLRHPEQLLVFEIQTTLERAMRAHWHEEGFLEIHTPKLKPTPNRSGDDLFTVEYFDGYAYLAQSPQFYKQMAMAAGFERVFEVGPVFRPQAEHTPWHDTEFTSVDVEMSWIDSHEEVMAFQERWLRAAVAAVADRHGDAVIRAYGVDVTVPELPFPRIAIDDARQIVEDSGHSLAHCPGDLDREGERRLAAHVLHAYGHELVFVTGYSEGLRPFYHMRVAGGSLASRSFDLVWNGLEVASGAQREHRHDVLAGQAAARGLALDEIGGFLDFFRFGCPPHGGFGLGLTRALMAMLRRTDVREVTYLPRSRQRLTP